MPTKTEGLHTQELLKHSSVESIEKELSSLDGKFILSKFNQDLEAEYKRHLNTSYIDTEKHVVLFGGIVFLSFIWIDFWIYPEKASLFVWLRIISSFLILTLIYIAFYKRLLGAEKLAMEITTVSAWIGTAVICIISYLLPNPYNIMYMVGVLPLLSGTAASLRNSAFHVIITVMGVNVLFITTLIANHFYGEHHPIDFVQEIMKLASPMLALFFFGVGLIAIYITFSIERGFRRQWLLMVRHNLNSARLSLLTQRFKNLSNVDDLTQIANRRQLFHQINEYLKSPDNIGKRISMIIVDIDYFKAYNDYYGHLQGDICLQTVASCLSESSEEIGATVARYGGEEFIVFLSETTIEETKAQAEKARQEIEQLELLHIHGVNGKITASFGITSTLINEQLSIEMLIKQADEALYEAKDKGRNQVVFLT